LQPLGRPEARLEGDEALRVGQAEAFAQQRAGALAFVVIGVAEVDAALRQAVEAQHQFAVLSGTAVGLPVFAHAGGERVEVARMFVVVAHEGEFGQVAAGARPCRYGVQRAGAGRGGELRIKRHDEDAARAGGGQRVELFRDRGIAVAHRVVDRHVAAPLLAEQALEQLGLAFGVRLERRAFRRPDGGVFLGGLLRPRVEDDAVEDEPPDRARNLDHARVPEELAEIAAQRGGGGRIGRAEVDEQDGGFHVPLGLSAEESRRALISTMGMTRS
jgi:hypothetical protein